MFVFVCNMFWQAKIRCIAPSRSSLLV